MLNKNKSLLIVGLGHIGLPIFFHYYDLGYDVFGIDTDQKKISLLKKNINYIDESNCNLDENTSKLFHYKLPEKKYENVLITININEIDGIYDIKNLERLIDGISSQYNDSSIIIRSTLCINSIAALRKKFNNIENSLYFCPEFLREGNARKDLKNNNEYYGVITHNNSNNENILVDKFYDAGLLTFLKISNNAWRATKVSFANLMHMILDNHEIDSKDFYELFISDSLNIDKSYLRPGAPFGGYCLPKETKALSLIEQHFSSNFFNEVIKINNNTVRYWVDKIEKMNPENVYFETFSFKSNIKDERFSPLITISEMLKRKNIKTSIYNEKIQLSNRDVYVSSSGNIPTQIKNNVVVIRGL